MRLLCPLFALALGVSAANAACSKQEAPAAENQAEPAEKQPEAAGKQPELSGKWRSQDFEVVLNADGTGTIREPLAPAEPMRWKASKDKLTVTSDGNAVVYSYKLTGDTLRVRGGDLDKPLTLSRVAAASKGKGKDKDKAARNAASSGGDCSSACRHFLRCAGQQGGQAQRECVQLCKAGGYDSAFLGWFQKTDCATAIAVIAALEAQDRGFEQQGQGGGRSGGGDCDGCVWDGSTCAWYSKGNWGTNVAYSGAVITCASSCCGR